MSMYQVSMHRTGKNATRSPNGDIWETGGGYPMWECFWQGRKKADAIAAADACPIHATVVIAYTAHVEYDNGKEPGSRIRDIGVAAQHKFKNA